MDTKTSTTTRQSIKTDLLTFTVNQQIKFRWIYARKSPELPLNEIVDNMSDEQIERTLKQVEATLNYNRNKPIAV